MEETAPQSGDNKKRWMILGIVLTVAAVAAIVGTSWNSGKNNRAADKDTTPVAQQAPKVSEPARHPAPTSLYGNDDELPTEATVITISDGAYTPNKITVPKGTMVYFVNSGESERWPASAMHPTHTLYPNSDISKCGTPEAGGIFDACRGLKKGEFWAFTFNESGEWRFHDHLRPQLNGSITVQ